MCSMSTVRASTRGDNMFMATNNLIGVTVSADSMDELIDLVNGQFQWAANALISRSTAYRALKRNTYAKQMWRFERAV